MNINKLQLQQNQNPLAGLSNNISTDATTSVYGKMAADLGNGFDLDVTGEGLDFSQLKNKAKSITDAATNNNAEFVAGTMTPSLAEGVEEEGVDLEKDDVKGIVTVVDKIQMNMIAGGDESVAATSQVDKEQILATMPSAIHAYEMAQELTTPTTQEISYLVGNELEPTIGNLYQAQNSVNVEDHASSGDLANNQDIMSMVNQIKNRVEEIFGKVDEEDLDMAKTLVSQGVELNQSNLNLAMELKNVTLPMSEEDTTKAIADSLAVGRSPMQAYILASYQLSTRAIAAEHVLQNATENEVETLVNAGEDLTIENLSYIQSGKTMKPDAEISQTTKELKQITAQRTLVEARLVLTASANITLLKQGINLETSSLEDLVSQMKSEEEQLLKLLLGDKVEIQNAKGEMVSSKEVYDTTNDLLTQFKAAQATSLVSVDFSQTLEVNVSNLNVTVTAANVAYETMQTEVRTDLGDSIQKAFGNVNDILQDLGLEESYENQRAVRILGYNSLEITTESISQMKVADEKVQDIFESLTPKVVLSMIREGYNPLDQNLDDLLAKAKEIKNEVGEDTDKYSKFLVKLESNKEIEETEREAYIGIYRLLRQVEKTDGAAIGALVHAEKEVTLRNLMTQVRTMRTGHVDKVVSEESGMLESDFVADLSITQQVEAVYQTSCLHQAYEKATPQLLKGVNDSNSNKELLDYKPDEMLSTMREVEEVAAQKLQDEEKAVYQKQIDQLKEATRILSSSVEVESFLEELDMPASAVNIEAASQVMNYNKDLYKNLFLKNTNVSKHQELMEEVAAIKEEIWQKFSEDLKTPKEMAEAYEALAETATHVMDGMIEDDDVQTLNLQEMKLQNATVSILGAMAQKETFAVPVLVADETGTVSLKIVQGERDKGKMALITELKGFGKIAASFSANRSGAKGFVVTETKETKEALFLQLESKLSEALSKEGSEEVQKLSENLTISFAVQEDVKLDSFLGQVEKGITKKNSFVSNEETKNETEISTKALYSLAQGFLKTLSQLEKVN